MKKSFQSNSANRRGNFSRKPQGRFQKSEGSPNRNRNPGPPKKNREATELWLKSSSQTLTSHIPLNTKPNRNNGGFRKTESRNGNPNQRQRQGQGSYQEKPRGPKNPKGRFNGQPQPNGKPAASPKSNAPLAAPADATIPRPTGLSKLVSNIEPFELFCAYHLGITPDKGYKPSNINEVANRFRVDPATIKQALKDYGMDSASLMDRDFDMALSQLDIQVAPEGVDRKELAKNLYEEYLEAPLLQRDWKKILEEDRRENQKVFRD